MSWMEGLIEEQIDVASYHGSHARLLAGPGTGKTLTLTRRILYLIEEQKKDPTQITALTFTRAATAELKERIKQALGEKGPFPRVSTLHSFALKMIIRNPTRTRLPQPIRIADDYEERQIVKEEIKNILNFGEIKEVEDLLNKLSADWKKLTAPEEGWEDNFPHPQFIGTWQEHRKIYGYTLRSELVYQLKLALEEEDFDFGIPIEYLLVDEYQDLNPCDLAVIRHLTEYGAELFCAGDDDQSIYGFRYANPEGIRRFPIEYTSSQSLELQTCMRCDKRILNFALYIACQDPRRIGKNLHCKKGAGNGRVEILRFPGQRQEADGIARICEWLINNGGIDPSEILILLRNDKYRKFSKVIYGSLHNRNIPVKIISNPLTSLEEFDGRQFICLLHLLINRRDHLAWRVLLDIRKNGIGIQTFEKIYESARTQGITFSEVLEQIVENPDILSGKGKIIQEEINRIKAILDAIDLNSYDNLLSFIVSFANDNIKDDKIREELISLFQKVIEYTDLEDLEMVLRAINTSIGDEEQDKHHGYVSIMTMHQAKGLSADAVFIAAAEDEYIPGRAQGAEIEDERRLLYVSLTRARHFLYITHCLRRTREQMHSGRTSGNPIRTLSQFLTGGPIRSRTGNDYINQINSS